MTSAAPIPAKALVADALIYLRPSWNLRAAQVALVITDFMFGASKREAFCSQRTIAARLGLRHEQRVREALAVIVRRPDEPHDHGRHVFTVSFECIPWGDGRRGGRKRSVYTLAPEFEAAVLRARAAVAPSDTEPPETPALRSTEPPETPALRLVTEPPASRERTAAVSETEPPQAPAMNPSSGSRQGKPTTNAGIEEPERLELLMACRSIANTRGLSLTATVEQVSSLPASDGRPAASFTDPRDRAVSLAWVRGSLARAHRELRELAEIQRAYR